MARCGALYALTAVESSRGFFGSRAPHEQEFHRLSHDRKWRMENVWQTYGDIPPPLIRQVLQATGRVNVKKPRNNPEEIPRAYSHKVADDKTEDYAGHGAGHPKLPGSRVDADPRPSDDATRINKIEQRQLPSGTVVLESPARRALRSRPVAVGRRRASSVSCRPPQSLVPANYANRIIGDQHKLVAPDENPPFGPTPHHVGHLT